MTARALQKFGVLRTVFRGTGSIRLSDGSDVRTRFTLGQLANTRLLICADVERPSWSFLPDNLEAESLQGTLKDGRKISATGLFIKEINAAPGVNRTRLVAYSGYWTISGPSIDGQASVVFELVNFSYLGTEHEIQVVNGFEHGALSLMKLTLGGREVQLRWIADYDQAMATLRAQGGVQVTCTATSTISESSEIDAVVSMIDTLCDTMSVARGTLTSWTSFEVHTADEVSPYSQYRNSVTRRYTGIELIGENDRQNTKSFLQEAFRKCEELDKAFQVRKIARAFVETRDGPFIESRSLLVAVLAEYLANVRAQLEDRTYLFSADTFNTGWESFRAKAKIALKEIYPDVADRRLRAVLDNMRGLNRRPLGWKLNSLATWLEVGFAEGEINNFVKIRDRLAHEGRFPEGGTPAEHYRRMQHFLDRLILRLFGYHGSYYDFEHSETRQI